MENPHKFFGLMPNKELVVFFYALSVSTISGAMYGPMFDLVGNSEFFRTNMDPTKPKGLNFKNRITIKTGSTISRNVGLDVFLVFMDEIQLERYKNQTSDNYNSLKARVKSRFMMDGGRFFNSMMILSGSPGSMSDFSEKLTAMIS